MAGRIRAIFFEEEGVDARIGVGSRAVPVILGELVEVGQVGVEGGFEERGGFWASLGGEAGAEHVGESEDRQVMLFLGRAGDFSGRAGLLKLEKDVELGLVLGRIGGGRVGEERDDIDGVGGQIMRSRHCSSAVGRRFGNGRRCGEEED